MKLGFNIGLVIILIIVIVSGVFYSNKKNTENHTSYTPKFESVDKEIAYSSDKLFIYAFNNQILIYSNGLNVEKDKYIGYALNFEKLDLDYDKVNSNYAVWNINSVSEYKRLNFDKFLQNNVIITKGEWDLALKEKGANDFVGGSLHGDEIATNFTVLVDDKEIDLSVPNNLEAEKIVINIESDIFRDNTLKLEDKMIAKRNKSLNFTNKGLIINQELSFTDDIVLDKSYLSMLPVLRKSNDMGGLQITDSVVFGGVEFDVSEAGFNSPEITLKKGNSATLLGKEKGYEITVNLLDKNPEIDSLFMLSNSERYNKMYFTFNNDGYSAEKGETWTNTTEYLISINQQ